MPRKSKRKKDRVSSGSDPQQDPKHYKIESCDHRDTDSVLVSELIGQSNFVLYEENNDLNNSVGSANCSVFSEPDITNTESHFEHTKMATVSKNNSETKVSAEGTDFSISEKLDKLLSVVYDLKCSQDSMRQMFESKLDKLKSDLIHNIDSKIKALREELSTDIGEEKSRTDEIVNTINSIQSRLNSLEEQSRHTSPAILNGHDGHTIPLEDHDITIIASGLAFNENEDLVQKAESLISALGDSVSDSVHITDVSRLPARLENKPGLVKISFRNKEEKVRVLRKKMQLKNCESYKSVFIRSSKSRLERLIESNARAILRSLPQEQNRSLRVDANGRITIRDLTHGINEANS